MVQGGMLGAGVLGGQRSILLFLRSTGQFGALLAASLKLLFMPKARAVASKFTHGRAKKQTKRNPQTPNVANQPPGNGTLRGNAGEFTFLNMYVIWAKGKSVSVCKTGKFLSHGVSI